MQNQYRLANRCVVMGAAEALPGIDVPGAVLTNERLCELMEQVSKELLEKRGIEKPASDPLFPYERAGISSRRIIDEDHNVFDLALAACGKLLEGRDDLDKIKAIVCACITQEQVTPCLAVELQEALRLGHEVLAIDVRVGCSGAAAALETAARMLAAFPEDSRILVIGADAMSRVMDASERGTCIIFGDGAGAVLLGNPPDSHPFMKTNPWLISACSSYSYGEEKARIEVRRDPDDFLPISRFVSRNGQAETAPDRFSSMRIFMDGRSVYKDMNRLVPEKIRILLHDQELNIEDIDVWMFHQANMRMIDAIAKRMGIPEDRLRSNIGEIGNTTDGSLPILLARELNLRPNFGKRMLMIGFGTGYAISALIFERADIIASR